MLRIWGKWFNLPNLPRVLIGLKTSGIQGKVIAIVVCTHMCMHALFGAAYYVRLQSVGQHGDSGCPHPVMLGKMCLCAHRGEDWGQPRTSESDYMQGCMMVREEAVLTWPLDKWLRTRARKNCQLSLHCMETTRHMPLPRYIWFKTWRSTGFPVPEIPCVWPLLGFGCFEVFASVKACLKGLFWLCLISLSPCMVVSLCNEPSGWQSASLKPRHAEHTVKLVGTDPEGAEGRNSFSLSCSVMNLL